MLKRFISSLVVVAVLLAPVMWNTSAYSIGKSNWQSVLSKARNYTSVLHKDWSRKFMTGATVVLMACGAFSCTADEVKEQALTDGDSERVLTDVTHSNGIDKLMTLTTAKGLGDAQISIDEEAGEIVIHVDGLEAEDLDRLPKQLIKSLEGVEGQVVLSQVAGEVLVDGSSYPLQVDLAESVYKDEGWIAPGDSLAYIVSSIVAVLLGAFWTLDAFFGKELNGWYLWGRVVIGAPVAGYVVYRILLSL